MLSLMEYPLLPHLYMVGPDLHMHSSMTPLVNNSVGLRESTPPGP